MSWLRNCNGLIACINGGQGAPCKSMSCSSRRNGRESVTYLPSNLPQIQDQVSIQHVLTDVQSFAVFFHPAKLWGFWPNLRIPLNSPCINSLLTHCPTATSRPRWKRMILQRGGPVDAWSYRGGSPESEAKIPGFQTNADLCAPSDRPASPRRTYKEVSAWTGAISAFPGNARAADGRGLWD